MFVFTTKFNRKKAIIIVLALAVALCAIILVAGSIKKSSETAQTSALSAAAKNNGQRVKFLKSLGWEVEEDAIEEQEVVIPRTFTDAYQKYNEIQLAQGFDLSRYGGVDATRYTYRILNYPGDETDVVADIIVYKGEIIAGDVQSSAAGGFMTGLDFPKNAAP